MDTKTAAYLEGFIKRCAELNLDPEPMLEKLGGHLGGHLGYRAAVGAAGGAGLGGLVGALKPLSEEERDEAGRNKLQQLLHNALGGAGRGAAIGTAGTVGAMGLADLLRANNPDMYRALVDGLYDSTAM
jgi:hypothetical protein